MKIRIIRSIYYNILKSRIGFYLFKFIFSSIKIVFHLLIRNKSDIIIFGAMNGIKYGDNARRLFEYFLLKYDEIECCWMTNSLKVWKELREKNLPVKLSWTFSGILTINKAKVGCYCNTLRDLSLDPLLTPDGLLLIALRHGKSVKGGAYSLKNYNDRYDHFNKYYHQIEHSKIEYVISTSDYISDLTDQMLKVGKEKYIITGFPRLDSLFEPQEGSLDFFNVSILNNKNYSKVLLYAPTWRDGIKPTKFFPFNDFNIEFLQSFLVRKNIKLLITPHFDDLMLFPDINKRLIEIEQKSDGHISVINHNKCQDLYFILPFIDILLTDYSSIYHDFLLMDKPIYFLPYDYEWYNNFFGFLYDYKKYKPGPEISTLTDFINELENSLNGVDKYIDKRNSLKNKIHYYKDSKSSERVANKIMEILN